MSTTMELTVGQVAERSGVAVSALHFYEAKGLIHSVRTAGNQRRYSRDTLRGLGNSRAWITNEHEHNGLRVDGEQILDRLIRLNRDR